MTQLNANQNHHKELNDFENPTLLMQSNPRQVVSANKKACELFGKDLSQIKMSLRGRTNP